MYACVGTFGSHGEEEKEGHDKDFGPNDTQALVSRPYHLEGKRTNGEGDYGKIKAGCSKVEKSITCGVHDGLASALSE